MAFGGLDHQEAAAPMAEINMTPLIDVMLVLLVIFIITAPLLTHAIRLDLPKVASASARELPDTITLSIDADGHLFWDATPLSQDALAARFRAAAAQPQPPELHLRAARLGPLRGDCARDGRGPGGGPVAHRLRHRSRCGGRAARARRGYARGPRSGPAERQLSRPARRLRQARARAGCPGRRASPPQAARDGLRGLSGRYNRPFPRDPGSATFDPLQPARASRVPTA